MHLQPAHKPPTTHTLTCQSDILSLYTHLTPEALSLLLYLKSPESRKTTVYEATINSKSQVVQVLGSLGNVHDYLGEDGHFFVEADKGSMRVVSRVEVKGVERAIDIGRIQIKMKEELDNVSIPTHIDLAKMQQYCQSTRQLSNSQIKQYFLHLITQITNLSSPAPQTLDPIINKIVILGQQHELLKSKLGGLSAQTEALNLTLAENGEKIGELEKRLRNVEGLADENVVQVRKLHEHVETEIQGKIEEIKGYVYEKFKEVFGELNENYQGLKKIMRQSAQYNPQNKPKPKPPSPHKSLFQFSKTFRHDFIRLLNDYSTATGQGDTRGKIALISPSIGLLKQSSRVEINLHIVAGAINVLVGVCDAEVVRALGYKVESWDVGGHGGYYINSGSYSYSSYRNEDNSQMKAFKYKDGDKIKVVCELSKKCIIFKNAANQTYMMPYDPAISEDKLCFGVIMHKDSCKVQILDVPV